MQRNSDKVKELCGVLSRHFENDDDKKPVTLPLPVRPTGLTVKTCRLLCVMNTHQYRRVRQT
jgi:hypothetical protein